MAVTVDNSITRQSSDGGSSITSSSFDVTTDDLIVLCIANDEIGDTQITTYTLSDNQTPDLSYTEINRRGGAEADAGAVINYYHRVVSPITGLTITVAVNASSDSPTIKVYKCTGYDTADIVGAINEGGLTTDPQNTTAITSETDGAFFANWVDWNTTGAPTSSDLTLSTYNITGDVSGASGYKAIGSAGASVTGNMNSPATPDGNWTCFEIRAAAGGGGTAVPVFYHHLLMQGAA